MQICTCSLLTQYIATRGNRITRVQTNQCADVWFFLALAFEKPGKLSLSPLYENAKVPFKYTYGVLLFLKI